MSRLFKNSDKVEVAYYKPQLSDDKIQLLIKTALLNESNASGTVVKISRFVKREVVSNEMFWVRVSADKDNVFAFVINNEGDIVKKIKGYIGYDPTSASISICDATFEFELYYDCLVVIGTHQEGFFTGNKFNITHIYSCDIFSK